MKDDSQTATPPPGASTWYLKIDDGSVFGPVEAETLCLWAQQGRIAPGNTISIDQTDWYPAEEYEELEMRWLVGLSNGTTYGPLNIRALAELVSDGTVAPDAVLEDVRTGNRSTPRERRHEIFLGGAVPPEFDQAPEEEEPGVEPEISEDMGQVARELATAIAEDEAGGVVDHASLDEKIGQFESTLKRTMTLLRAHQRELEREKEENQEIRGELEARENQLASVREELARKSSALEGLRSQLDETRRTSQTESARIQALEDVASALRGELETAKSSGAEFSQTLKAREEALQAKEAELARLYRNSEQFSGRLQILETELADSRKVVEDQKGQLEAARQEATSLREQSAERERALLDQVNSLKEDVQVAARTLETLKVDLRKAQEGALDAQKVRQSLDQERQRVKDLETRNAALKKRLRSGQAETGKQVEQAKKKLDKLQRAVEEFEKTEVVIPELVGDDARGESDGLSSLADLELQAQRELRAWQMSRKR